jgi:hypothetical protein
VYISYNNFYYENIERYRNNGFYTSYTLHLYNIFYNFIMNIFSYFASCVSCCFSLYGIHSITVERFKNRHKSSKNYTNSNNNINMNTNSNPNTVANTLQLSELLHHVVEKHTREINELVSPEVSEVKVSQPRLSMLFSAVSRQPQSKYCYICPINRY